MGFAYSIGYAAIGPSIAYVTKPNQLGKANGIVVSIQNMGFFILPYIIAFIKVLTGSYDYSQIVLILLNIIGIRIGYIAYKENLRRGEILEMGAEKMADVKTIEVLELLENRSQYNYRLLEENNNDIFHYLRKSTKL